MNACITLPIAIIGVGVRLPGAVTNLDSLWTVLKEGRDCIVPIPKDRFNAQRFYHPDRMHPGTSVCMQAGIIDSIYDFDCDFFGISPKEAQAMDPQQRILLELTWEALEDAGITPSSLANTDTCVYVGAASPDSGTSHADDLCATSPYSMTGTNLSIIANRISYIFNWHGPSFTLDTACSSSIYALHAACQTLALGGASLAVACGVNVLLAPYPFVGFSQAYMLSQDGHCKVFDAHGNGYVRGEGGGVLLLEPLELALANKHPIKAIIRGIGCNSDGRTQGIALPSSKAQEDLLNSVYEAAKCDPNSLSYFEAHGTGTVVGDPLEARAIGLALGQKRSESLPIGSIKCHVGHLETASAMAGIMKALVMMRERKIPAQIWLNELNPDIDFKNLNLRVPRALEDFPKRNEPLRVGINSFGFGGANGHVLIEEAQDLTYKKVYAQGGFAESLPPLCLQAKSKNSLAKLAYEVSDTIANDPHNYAAIAATLGLRRENMPFRLVAEAENVEQLKVLLKQDLDQGQVIWGQSNIFDQISPKTAFVFTGNGCHWLGMAQDLLTWPIFWDKITEVAKLFEDLSGIDLIDCLKSARPEDLEKTELTQPLIFMIQMGICAILAEQGIVPQVVFGHSVGEVAAVEAAGLLSLADAVKVIYYRSLYQGKTKGLGQMAAAKLEVSEAQELAKTVGFNEVEIAGINAQGSLTLSGSTRGLAAIGEVLAKKRSFFKFLPLDYAFHSSHMEMIAEDLKASLADLKTQTPTAEFISSVSEYPSADLNLCGQEPKQFSDFGAEYWWENIRRPVQFSRTIHAALNKGVRCFLEISPHAILQQYLRSACKAQGITALISGTMQRKSDNFKLLQRAWKQLWVHGWPIDLNRYLDSSKPLANLPTYPWDRKPLRLESTVESLNYLNGELVHPLLGYSQNQGTYIFENELDLQKMPWLKDHRVGEACFYPAAGFLEMAMACGKAKYGFKQPIELQNTAILRPVIFDPQKSTKFKVVLENLDGDIRIYSRPLMQSNEWVLQTKGRVISSNSPRPPRLELVKDYANFGQKLKVSDFYALTCQANMNYGPYFQPLEALWQKDQQILAKFLDADLTNLDLTLAEDGMLIPPTLIDGGLQLIFQAIAPYIEKSKAPRLPYWFDRCVLYAQGRPSFAYLELVRASERNAVCNLQLLDANGDTLLLLTRGRARTATRLKRKDLAKFYTTNYLPSSLTLKELDIEPSLKLLAKTLDEENSSNSYSQTLEARYLQRACAEALVKEVFQDHLESASLDSFKAKDLLPQAFIKYLQIQGKKLTTTDQDLPSFSAIWQTLIQDYPSEAQANMLLLALRLTLTSGQSFSHELIANYVDNLVGQKMAYLKAAISSLKAQKDPHTTLKIAVQGLSRSHLLDLENELASEELWVTYPNSETLNVSEEEPFWNANRALYHFAPWNIEKEISPSGPCQLVILAQVLNQASDIKLALNKLKLSLAPYGQVMLLEREPSLVADLIQGTEPSWWSSSTHEDEPFGRLLTSQQWVDLFKSQGFTKVTVFPKDSAQSDGQFVLMAQVANASESLEETNLANASSEFLGLALNSESLEFLQNLSSTGTKINVVKDFETLAKFWNAYKTKVSSAKILCPLSATLDLEGSLKATNDFLEVIKGLAKANLAQAELILLTRGALVLPCDCDSSPSAAALLGGARVLMNEMPNLRLKVIDLTLNPDQETLKALSLELEKCSHNLESEVEIALRGNKRFILRSSEIIQANLQETSNFRLEILDPGHLESLTWLPCALPKPKASEVLVEMRATGLNFRDVMWAMNLLPEEALEQGFSGPGLGIEGSGVVVAIGDQVTNVHVGSKVVCFGPNCFKKFVLTQAQACAELPENLDLIEAATLPVTFFTAYYALNYLARLTAKERLLIHGAAGGVGLAALQIAKYLGLEVYATCGSPLKRALLAELGVKHIYDSRSLAFKDEILRDTQGEGVDCVLNSLAGEALSASLQVLRPFGRFLELGKSDFYADSPLRLKPFSNNVSYFGIDVDQLMLKRGALGQKLFAELMELFGKGILKPLPCTVVAGNAVESAFRLMQKSKHVGKIVVLPPDSLKPQSFSQANINVNQADQDLAVTIKPQASYLISGGLAGFGLATAKSLVDRGADHLILVSRSGENSNNTKDLEALRAREVLGHKVKVKAIACDVSDFNLLSEQLKTLKDSFPPIKGIIHAAANLKDALMLNMTPEAMAASLTPKIGGALSLDKLSQDLDLDFFVVYSSVTTILGNPGQSNYVAANLAMENLMAKRRALGKPGLAIGWGAILDYGMLTRDAKTLASIQEVSGMVPLKAKQALDILFKLPKNSPAYVAIFAADWPKLAKLPIAKQPRFSPLVWAQDLTRSAQNENLSLRIKGLNQEEAYDLVLQEVISQIARILRAPNSSIRPAQPLQSLGLDSLMGVELSLALEDLCGRPLAGTLNANLSAEELALQIVQILHEESQEYNSVAALAKTHGVNYGGLVAEESYKVEQALKEGA